MITGEACISSPSSFLATSTNFSSGLITVMTPLSETKQTCPCTVTAEAPCSRPIRSFHASLPVLASRQLAFPLFFYVTIIITMFFIGDGLRDALDPKDR